MDWWQLLIIILFSLLALMFIRLPVAFSFFAINIAGAITLFGGGVGLNQLIMSVKDSLVNFALIPIPLFILMGEIMFHAGLAQNLISAIDKWFGKVPGRLSVLAVGSGTALSTLTGSSIASTAILGSTLVPEMEKRGYKKSMTIGPVLGGGALAVLIPPSALGVLLASIAKISIGTFMVAIVIPGLLTALIFCMYIIIRAKLQPDSAPAYETGKISLSEKIIDTIKYILPLGFIVFLVIGLIILGVATATEAAAMGAFGSLVLAALYGNLNRSSLSKAFIGTMKVSTMMLMIVAGSTAFSQILAYSGVTQEMVYLITDFPVSPIWLLILMLGMIIFMGTFMEGLSILMIVMPIFMPVAIALGFDLFWFTTLILMAIEIGAISPPFGLGLFALKSVISKDNTMMDIYKAAIPFAGLFLLVLVLLIIFPQIVTWLPSIMAN